ncbi:MAG: hypothetical protein IPH62_18350 [Ignavibacteriae bacterium]|nr:hypothetical protein [Ignavibacteriota bacterium]
MRIKTRVNLIILILLFGINLCYPQKILKVENFKSEFAKKVNKKNYYGNLEREIDKTLSNVNEINSKNWISAFSNAQSIFYKSQIVKTALNKVLKFPIDKNIKLQKSALETAFTLYLNVFSNEIQKIANYTNDNVSFAISVNYLLANEKTNIEKYLSLLKSKFPNYLSIPVLNNLKYDLELKSGKISENIPSIKNLLDHPFQKGKTIIYSIQRKNRKFTGITIIKKPDGSFVKNKDGSVFNIPQLALSYSNLPEYIPNGNTPQGVYSIIGTYISPNKTIGPTPNILARSPFEVSPNIFFHSSDKNIKWDYEDYKNLLPTSWQNYVPIFKSFYAGKSGRKLIIIHGSTDELNYYKNDPYFPLTPTQGCLSSKEIWDEQNGKCLESDQIKLINAFNSTHQKKGFLIVFEIDNKEKPVSIEEILPYIK